MVNSTYKFWHHSVTEVLEYLKTNDQGLSEEEAAKRQKTYGSNFIESKKRRGPLLIFIGQFASPLVLILVFASIIAIFLKDITEALIILSIILASVLLSFYQENKSEKTVEALKERLSLTTSVLRSGTKREISVKELVPGDIVFLSAGDVVPADARLIESKNLLVNEAALTGESFPVEKNSQALPIGEYNINEINNCLFSGSFIESGTCSAVITVIGKETEFGSIAKNILIEPLETEFQASIKNFSYLIARVTVFLVLFIFVVNTAIRQDYFQSFIFALALAVGLTPELLPVIITLNLSKGVLIMSKNNVLVKRLSSISDIGSIDILCTDKTGTLTDGEVKIKDYYDLNLSREEKILLFAYANSHFQTGIKSPIDQGILNFKEIDVSNYTKFNEIPFDFNRKRLSVLLKDKNEKIMITKGAFDQVLSICNRCEIQGEILALNEYLERIIEEFQNLSGEGYRVIAVAYKMMDDSKSGDFCSINDEKDMTLLGFVALYDPPKQSTIEALKMLRAQGIKVKVLSGDNEKVIQKVCEEVGLTIEGAITGHELDNIKEEALPKLAEKTTMFAGITPEQKARIINALRRSGHIVGFMGDGINDAPSLHLANVGISVDNAVNVAKESADIILLGKSLIVLSKAIEEGRKVYANTIKYLYMATSANFGNMFSVSAASLFLPFLPMLPSQILLNNFITDFPELAISTDNVDSEFLARPSKWNINFIRKYMIFFGLLSSLFDIITFGILLYIFEADPILFRTGWFAESIISATTIVMVLRTNRVFYKSKPSKYLLTMTLFVIGLVITLPYTPLAAFLGFAPLPLVFYSVLSLVIFFYVLSAELVKKWFYSNN